MALPKLYKDMDGNIHTSIPGENKNTTKKVINNDDYNKLQTITQTIRNNSQTWHDSDEAGRKQLHDTNTYLYGEADKITGGKSTFNPNTGKWTTSYNDGEGNWYADTFPTAYSYNGINQQEISNLKNDINNSKFSYDPESDPSYQAYKQMYNREGDRASKSTLADIATAQGGMSSYAGAAAQQASNYYAQQLTDKIPYLEQLAYQKYSADLDNKYNMLNMLTEEDNTNYNRWLNDINRQDSLDQWNWQTKTYADEWDYQKKKDNYDIYTQNQSNLANTGWQKLQAGIPLSEQELAALNMTQEQADAYMQLMYYGSTGSYLTPYASELLKKNSITENTNTMGQVANINTGNATGGASPTVSNETGNAALTDEELALIEKYQKFFDSSYVPNIDDFADYDFFEHQEAILANNKRIAAMQPSETSDYEQNEMSGPVTGYVYDWNGRAREVSGIPGANIFNMAPLDPNVSFPSEQQLAAQNTTKKTNYSKTSGSGGKKSEGDEVVDEKGSNNSVQIYTPKNENEKIKEIEAKYISDYDKGFISEEEAEKGIKKDIEDEKNILAFQVINGDISWDEYNSRKAVYNSYLN